MNRRVTDAAENAARSGVASARSAGRQTSRYARGKAADLAERARDAGSDLVETGSEYAREAGSYASSFKAAVQRKPFAALGFALLAGLALGLFRRRN
jgi:hypothetical protein